MRMVGKGDSEAGHVQQLQYSCTARGSISYSKIQNPPVFNCVQVEQYNVTRDGLHSNLIQSSTFKASYSRFSNPNNPSLFF